MRPPFLKCQFMLFCDSAIHEAKKLCISWHRAMLVLQGAARREGLHQRWTMAKTGHESHLWLLMFNACRIKFVHRSTLLRCVFSHMHGSYHLGCSANAIGRRGRCVVAFVCKKFRVVTSIIESFKHGAVLRHPATVRHQFLGIVQFELVGYEWMDEHDHGLPRRSILPFSWTALVEVLCLIRETKVFCKVGAEIRR